MKKYIFGADICLPDGKRIEWTKWATVACDQYTSEPEYWKRVKETVGDTPSTLSLMLPEVYLDKENELLPEINGKMSEYLSDGTLVTYKDVAIYLERTQSDGRVRRGLVVAIDLEDYDFHRGSETLIRATEGTVLERIPPRVAIRRGAMLEMPHIMMLIDDPERAVVEKIAKNADKLDVAYDFDLMERGGHVKGYFVGADELDRVNCALSALATRERMQSRYGVDAAPLLFAIGDGNHSLASAKSLYEEIKAEIGDEAAQNHPARYALCELVNLHDPALEFEPIYRVVFGVEPESFVAELEEYVGSLCGSANEQNVEVYFAGKSKQIKVGNPTEQLAVGTVQVFLDKYIAAHSGVSVDYIHGEDTARNLAEAKDTVAILFDGMSKDMLFKTVICDGALPRKTFSMGHAEDKRFYIECRKIR